MWTMDNTTGFTQQQLDMINTAYDIIAATADEIDEKNINDAITNAWAGQTDAEQLAAVVLKEFGY